jgi:anaerobic magnesium-protoporphyrin IX monomethyl ester cyclase
MNKIVFINPPYTGFMEPLDAPFNLMYLAAVAEGNGWQAEIVDMKTLEDPIPEAEAYGVTATSPQWPDAVLLSEQLEKEFPDSLTIAGGNHVSGDPSSISDSRFDLVIMGEGELSLGIALKNLGKKKKLLKNINMKRVAVKGVPIHDLDTIPFPARHLVDWSRYKRGIYVGKEKIDDAVSIISSRGCPYNCIFCGSHVVFGHRTRFRSVKNVIAEMRKVIREMDYWGFNFHDDTFCLNKRRVFRLCKEMKKLDITWRCLSRVDTADQKMFKAMAESGCQEVILGVESGSQKILDKLNKGTTVEQNIRAMNMVKEAGIQLKVGIIVGSPGETWETVKETMFLLDKCPPDFWNVSCFTPFPGCAAWENPEKYGIKILTKDLRQYAMVGDEYKGNVVCETEEMSKADIEHARDELIELCQSLAPV